MDYRTEERIRARGLETLELNLIPELLEEIREQQQYIRGRAVTEHKPRYNSYIKTYAKDQSLVDSKILQVLEALVIKVELLEERIKNGEQPI